MKKALHVNNSSVEHAGLPRDVGQALMEFIWNSLDAKATVVDINFDKSAIGGITTLRIIDNGTGINYSSLDGTFGLLLDSNKKTIVGSPSAIHGRKGRGRFSFSTFAESAKWNTIYHDND